jgi:hypothetical protein
LHFPVATWLKCIVDDGALFTSEGKCGIDIRFQDCSGSLVQAHTMMFPFKQKYIRPLIEIER